MKPWSRPPATPKGYSNVLREMATLVRRNRGRFAYTGTGIHDGHLISQRIDRVLGTDCCLKVPLPRKLLVAARCAGSIFLAVACGQQQVDNRPAPLALDAEIRTIVTDLLDDNEEMTPERATELEAFLIDNPDNPDARFKLLIYYAMYRPDDRKDPNLIRFQTMRMPHVRWLVRNEPQHPLAGGWAAHVSHPRNGFMERLSDAGTEQIQEAIQAVVRYYEEIDTLWRAHAQRSDASAAVLGNAAYHFGATDKSLAEQMLLRAQALDSSDRWSARLGNLYAMALTDRLGYPLRLIQDPTLPPMNTFPFGSTRPSRTIEARRS